MELENELKVLRFNFSILAHVSMEEEQIEYYFEDKIYGSLLRFCQDYKIDKSILNRKDVFSSIIDIASYLNRKKANQVKDFSHKLSKTMVENSKLTVS